MKKIINYILLVLLCSSSFLVAQNNVENTNYDDAYFEVSDLENHPIYSKMDPVIVENAKLKEQQNPKPNTKSYGQTYTDRLKNFDNYNTNRYRNYNGYYGYSAFDYSNPYHQRLMMYNVNPYFNYGPGLYSFYSPYTGVYNSMYYNGYCGYYDPNWIYYNQMFVANGYGMNYYNNNASYNNIGTSKPKQKAGLGRYNPQNNSTYGGSNTVPNTTSNSSSNNNNNTRSSNPDEVSNSWRDTRNSSGSGSGSGTKSNESGATVGGSGRRR